MARLILLTPAELTRDPRARRAAIAAATAGWDVVGICMATGGTPVALDGARIVRVGGEQLDVALRGAGLGGGRRDRPLLRELRGLYRIARLLRTTWALWVAGRGLQKTDVVHANDFDTLPAAWLLARGLSARLVYDAHEMYTLQEVDPPRFHLMTARLLERVLARRADAVVTVSDPIARELQSLLRLPKAPLVVLNCPARSERAAPVGVGRPLRAVYQGAVGHARSVEDLLDAATVTDGVELSLRIVGMNTGDLRKEIARRGLADRVVVLDPVDPAELADALTTFDVGVIVTRPATRNDELAAPNKLFEYLMAGLAVAAPRLPGVAAIVESEHVGVTFDPGSPRALADALSRLADHPAQVEEIKQRARQLALSRFNAEAQAPVLAAAWGA